MLITMSDKEIQRLAVLQDVRDHRITQVRAAEILNLSTRQITGYCRSSIKMVFQAWHMPVVVNHHLRHDDD
jgi:hypothetical protein